MADVHVSFAVKTVFLILAAVIAASVSALIYRVTIPPISSRLKAVLTVLRALGLFLVFLLIAEPLLSLIVRKTEDPIVAVLVDNTKSLTVRLSANQQRQKLAKLLESTPFKDLSGVSTVRLGLFSDRVRLLKSFSPDSLTLDGDATDISAALKALKEEMRTENLRAVIIISDGNSTTGSNPLYEGEELGVPVFCIGIGDTSDQRDILVRKVLTNEITYVGTRVPVNATVRSVGYSGQRVEVLLRDDAKILDRRFITTEEGTRDYDVELSFVPDKEGIQKYGVEVSAAPGELTTRNNRTTFFTKVLRSKMRVTVIAGAPSQDVAFIRRGLEADKNLEVKTFIGRGAGQFYEGQLTSRSLDETDCIFLVGFPTSQSTEASISAILNAANLGKPFFYILSRSIDYAKLRMMERFLPVVPQSGSTEEYQAFLDIADAQRANPLVRLQINPSVDVWAKLPPIFKTQSLFRPKPESEILAFVKVQTTTLAEPFLVSRNLDGKKSLALLGYGVWRWSMWSEPGSGNVLEQFLSNSVRWLTTREDERRVRVQTTKQVFTTQEPIEFSAQVYDQSYQPVDNARITITLQHGKQTSETTLSSVGSGRYEASISQLAEGDYRFTATVAFDGKQLSGHTGRFSVGGFNAEYLETKLNKPLLQRLSYATGGKYYDESGIGPLSEDIRSLANFLPRDQTRTTDFELWNASWMLGLSLC